MGWLLAGLAVLVVAGLAWRALGQMNPSRLAQALKWTAVVGLGLVGLWFLSRRAVGPGVMCLTFAGAIAVWPRQTLTNLGSGSASATRPRSVVETPWLRMSLDHASGDIDGVVLTGHHAGRSLADLDEHALLGLLRDLRRQDEEGAQLLETYLRRVHPDLDLDADRSQPGRDGAMDRARALEVLGLRDDATEADVREAHRRLIREMHPDQGGSSYLAAQINEGRDVLLPPSETSGPKGRAVPSRGEPLRLGLYVPKPLGLAREP